MDIDTMDWSKYPITFMLRFCEPLPEVSEDELIDREWAISQDEVEEMVERD